MRNRPNSVHTVSEMFSDRDTEMEVEGKWVRAIARPYPSNRLMAAWWVLTGRAEAVVWPSAGDLEKIVSK